MKCPECLGTGFESGRFDVAQMFKQQPVVIKNIPAQRCIQCGHLLISSKVADDIEAALVAQTYQEVIPSLVFDLAAQETTQEALREHSIGNITMESGSKPLRIWAGERGETANIGVMVYGDRLPPGVSVDEVRETLVRAIEEVVRARFGDYGYAISRKAKSWLTGS